MKKEDLKNIIKPLVKECIKEFLLEEGLRSLTNKEIVTEQIQEKNTFVQQKSQNKGKIDYSKIFNKETVEKNKKLGFDLNESGFNPFQGTVSTDELERTPSPTDKKVNSLINEGAGDWTRILDAMKARK